MLSHTTKITSKGQITLPKAVRDFLHSDMITFEMVGNHVVIKPLHTVGGSLKQYQKNISFQKARDDAWNEVVRDHKI